MAGTSEYQVLGPTKTEEMESHRNVCTLDHDIPSHVTNSWLRFCLKSDGDEVELLVEAPEGESEHTDEETEHTEPDESTGERSCHFHAGIE
jgi:zinc transporter 1/2/3